VGRTWTVAGHKRGGLLLLSGLPRADTPATLGIGAPATSVASRETSSCSLALVERPGRSSRTRYPAELALDLVDKLLNPLCRRVGLVLLHADESPFVLLIGEPEIERAVDDQCHSDQNDKQERVFAH